MSAPRSHRHPVVFIGAGPGAVDLVTVRGAKALAAAEVVLADALIDDGFRDLAPNARWVDVGKRGFCKTSTDQATIDALLVRYALEGHRVVRLKGGDPSIFGRLEEELEALAAANIPSEVIPGVTAASAAAAATQRPLTRRGRGRSVALVTAMTEARHLQAERSADSAVFYMAGRQLANLARKLADAGWRDDTPVLVVSRAGAADEIASDHTVATLPAAAMLHAGRPAVVFTGVAALPVSRPSAPVILSEAKNLVVSPP